MEFVRIFKDFNFNVQLIQKNEPLSEIPREFITNKGYHLRVTLTGNVQVHPDIQKDLLVAKLSVFCSIVRNQKQAPDGSVEILFGSKIYSHFENNVEFVFALLKHFSSAQCLLSSFLGKIAVDPPREAVFLVVDALAVSQKNDFLHHCHWTFYSLMF